MGTSLTNITAEILKFKVQPDAGVGGRQEYFMEAPRAIKHEELEHHEIAEHLHDAGTLALLNDDDFDDFVKGTDLAMVAFGAPWCPWSQRLEPVWRKTFNELRNKPFGTSARLARVDCTAQNAQQLCHKHHIHAFPTIRVFRHRNVHSHENYLGDRDSAAFLSFIEEMVPKPHDSDRAPKAFQQPAVIDGGKSEGHVTATPRQEPSEREGMRCGGAGPLGMA